MTTIDQRLTKYLTSRGVSDVDAVAILQNLHASQEDMHGRWDDHIEGYPTQLVAVLVTSLKSTTVEWIDKNFPGHPSRPLFED